MSHRLLRTRFFFFLLLVAVGVPLPSSLTAQVAEFQPLLNGKDLDGWVRTNTDASTWSVRDGMLVCTGKPIGELRTARMYQNFILELEWRHMVPRGNAGIFVWADDITSKGVPFHRGIEVQVLENEYGNTKGYSTHGDIFPIHGATMQPVNGRGGSRAFPTENRSKPSPNWNHYRIVCRDGEITLAVNGKIVTQGKECSPSKGYICIESEGGVVHYRNLRIQELPNTPIEARHVAIADRGYRSLYTGLNLDGWRPRGAWRAADWQLRYAASQPGSLRSADKYQEIDLLFDFKLNEVDDTLALKWGTASVRLAPEDKAWHRVEAKCRNGKIAYSIDGQLQDSKSAKADAASVAPASFSFEAVGPLVLANIYKKAANGKTD